MQDLESSGVPDTVDGVPSLAPQGKDTPGPEDPEVLRDVGLFQVQFLTDIGHATAFLIQKFEDLDPRGVGEGFEIFGVYGSILIHVGLPKGAWNEFSSSVFGDANMQATQ